MYRLFTSIWLVLVFLISANVSAETQYVCAAVYPCDDEGNLLDEFSDYTSPCFDYYINQCTYARIRSLNERLAVCEADKESREEIISLKKRVRKLRRKIHSLIN